MQLDTHGSRWFSSGCEAAGRHGVLRRGAEAQRHLRLVGALRHGRPGGVPGARAAGAHEVLVPFKRPWTY